jgi:L-amino acid N-acyltransferase YncA
METQIRFMTPKDWEAVRQIYLEGIATGQATFEIESPSWDVWNSRHLPFARLIACNAFDDEVAGWAALAPVSTRPVYAGVAEVSIYVASAARRRGIGQRLLTSLIAESEKNGIWTLQASIFPENRASLTLHRKCGFRRVGKRVRIAQLGGVWRDTILIERRSKIAGQ